MRLWRRKRPAQADIARLVERGTISPSWPALRFETISRTARREQARKKQERRVLARLLLNTRDR